MAGNVFKSPLTPAVFHILLALSHEPLHGYGIMKQVELDSQGSVTMGPGTLYGSISRMINAGLIHETDPPSNAQETEEANKRRIYYILTPAGKSLLQTELERYSQVVSVAKKIRILPTS